jgi:hypothetical protein
MALEVKVLDYGDIELESSFWCWRAIAAAPAACRSTAF